MAHEEQQRTEVTEGAAPAVAAGPAAAGAAPAFGWTARRPPGLSPAMALRLQSGAGNAAVAALVAREAAPAAPLPAAEAPAATPATPAPATPAPAPAADAAPAAGPAEDVDPALEFIAGYARRVPGYSLLSHAIGADPITGARVQGSLLREVVEMIPHGAELMQRLEQSGAIDRAGAWLRQEIPTLGLSYASISALFERAWESISAWDLWDPSAAWDRLAGIFTPPIQRVIAFAERAADKLLELSLEAMMAAAGGGGEQVLGILRRAGEAFGAIVRDPMGFARNLVAAVRGGFERFAQNIGAHLQRGLLGWLTGALQGALRLPQRLDFEGIVDLATQVLGLTWDRLRERLVRMIGPRRVAFLERSVDFVRDIATRGLGAAWEKIKEFATGLADQVFDAIRNWISESIIGAALRRLVTMFNPVGALINAVIGIYDTIQFIVERARQIGELIDAVSTSIAEIASGTIGRAVDAVENALGRALPVAISFLAELIGLDNVGERVRETIERLREMVDNAIDRLLDWIVSRFSGRSEDGDQAAGEQEPPADETQEARHERLATAAAAEIGEESEEEGDYDSVRDETEAKARQVEAKYAPQMEEGIGFKVEFDDESADREDEDIDFTVVIAPNTTKVKGKKALAPVADPESDFELMARGKDGEVGIGLLFIERWDELSENAKGAVLTWLSETDQVYGARIVGPRQRVSSEDRKAGNRVAGLGNDALDLSDDEASGHTPDMAGGARPDAPQIGLLRRINSSIGGQWGRYQPGFVFAGISCYDADEGVWIYLSGAHNHHPGAAPRGRP